MFNKTCLQSSKFDFFFFFFSQSSRVIWLGDLNYRIALSYRSATALVEMQNWRALLENDQACFLSWNPLCFQLLTFRFITYMKKTFDLNCDVSLHSYVKSKEMVVFLRDGMKERYIFPQLTSIQLIQTDMQGMICIQRRSAEHLPGKIICPILWATICEIIS